MIIANPIYDSVFKFLMEDERVAKVLLSALLKKEVREVTMRRNEYTNMQQSRISLFRIDFSAKIIDPDGQERLVLIELQKTWLATETLRFRQYLGTQYLSQENLMTEDDTAKSNRSKGYGLPMISIYILGHKLGDLQQPVVYVHRHYLDYDNQQIQKGVPDPFIESLTHDSIIVQIPYLQGSARNHLERMLHVFDQDYRLDDDNHLMNIDEHNLTDDERLLINRLALAATSSGLRRDMQVEDEILSEIESRDTTILLKDKEIEKKSQMIEQKKQVIEQKEQVIEQKKQVIEQKEQVIEQKKQVIEQKEQVIEQKEQVIEQKSQVIEQKEQVIEQKEQVIEQKSQVIEQKEQEIEQKKQVIEQKKQEIEKKSQEIEQKSRILQTTVQNLSYRGLSVSEIASILSIPETEVSALLVSQERAAR